MSKGNYRVLLRSHIEHAMNNTKSNTAAAKFLGVSRETYVKYAALYIDEATGKTLCDLHANPRSIGIEKNWHLHNGYLNLDDILAGKHPDYDSRKLKDRLLRSNYMPNECCNCGMSEKRITDGRIPLILDWIDGDRANHHLDNLRFLCYNCYFLLVGNISGKHTNKVSMLHTGQNTRSLEIATAASNVLKRPHPKTVVVDDE